MSRSKSAICRLLSAVCLPVHGESTAAAAAAIRPLPFRVYYARPLSVHRIHSLLVLSPKREGGKLSIHATEITSRAEPCMMIPCIRHTKTVAFPSLLSWRTAPKRFFLELVPWTGQGGGRALAGRWQGSMLRLIVYEAHRTNSFCPPHCLVRITQCHCDILFCLFAHLSECLCVFRSTCLTLSSLSSHVAL